MEGYDIRTAESGPDALAALEKGADLVIVEIQMPDMDGLELVKRFRGISALADLPIIMIAAFDMKADRLKAAETGANSSKRRKSDARVPYAANPHRRPSYGGADEGLRRQWWRTCWTIR